MKIPGWLSVFTFLLLLVDVPVACGSERAAVLPFADLTRDLNGIDLEFTGEVERALERYHFEIIPREEVFAFMDENRMRRAGVIDPLLARKLGEELGCRYLFVGTVLENRPDDKSFAYTMNALDAGTGAPVWSVVEATGPSDRIRVLGWKGPDSLPEICSLLLDSALGNFRRELRAGSPALEAEAVQVLGIDIGSDYVRGGARIDCRLALRTSGFAKKELFLEGPWGRTLLVAERPEKYKAEITAPLEEGTYSLNLVLESEGATRRLDKIASFRVVNALPRLHLDVGKGIELEGVPTFRDQIVFSPFLERPHALDRWALEIRGSDGKVAVYEEHEGTVPERLVWAGTASGKKKVPDGEYDFRLRVWDRAGNQAETGRRVALRSRGLSVAVNPVFRGNRIFLQVESEEAAGVPIAFWSLRIASATGETLVERSGHQLPLLLEIPIETETDRLLCDFVAKDLLGNRIRLDGQTVELRPGSGEESEGAQSFVSVEKAGSFWVGDF